MTANAARAGKITIGADLEVNRLGYGAMRLTGEGVWGPHPDHENAIAVLKKVIELGVDFIDTANSYGPETNESLIHEALYPYPEGLVIATKGGLTRSGPNKWERNGDPVHLREQCELSLQRLGLETIDLYQLHAPDPEIPYAESVGALAELQREGLIRHVGISNVDSVQLEVALDVVDVVSVQNRFSISDRGSLEVLLACERHGLAFLPWFPLVAGSLEEDEVIDRIAARHDATRYQVAIAWLLQRSPVMLPIPGTSSIAHLEENVAAGAIRLSEEEMLELEAVA
ncbi:MAG: oxidoreductase [Solirubrobacteraceae bacterium]|nr:oxidoreductase [Solirubrobacteraceae bacterium]